MALLGTAALAMWWDMDPAMRSEFEHWHSHEHFPERLGLPGFRRASRWGSATGGPGIFVLYELEAHEALNSSAYLARLDAPTPWSRKMMPHHANMVRSPSRVLHSRGGGVAGHGFTLRLSPQAGRAHELSAHLAAMIDQAVGRPGIAGVHLLQTHTPAIVPTVEQQMRGGADRAADWIVLACGYDAAALQALATREFAAAALLEAGAAAGEVRAAHTLLLSMVPADTA